MLRRPPTPTTYTPIVDHHAPQPADRLHPLGIAVCDCGDWHTCGNDIPGGAALVFEMELLGIKPAAVPAMDQKK